MSQTPFEQASNFHIGIVDFVSPDEIKVSLDIEAPESIAMNTGHPRPFPRVNSYLLIAVDDGLIVGQIEWITIERSAYPKRRGMQDFGLVDLPYPLRKISLNPLGTLRVSDGPNCYSFNRGVDSLPTIGAAAVLPTDEQLCAIVESGAKRRVQIGVSPLAANAKVCIDPNRLFGRHLAVLGNTGSGKSCSVAGLIRWSLEQAKQTREQGNPNARFIVLDPNGEYSRAFSGDDSIKARIFKINPVMDQTELKVPLWFWNSAEWCTFMQASAKTQRPLLIRALREVKAGRIGAFETTDEEKKLELRRYLSRRTNLLQRELRMGTFQTDASKFGYQLKAYQDDLERRITTFSGLGIEKIIETIKVALIATFKSFVDKATKEKVEYYHAFTEDQVKNILDALQAVVSRLGGLIYQEGPEEDVPLEYNGTDLVDHLEDLANQENSNQYLDFLIARIRAFLSDTRMKSIIEGANSPTLEQWLNTYIGEKSENCSCVSVIDLALVPTEVIHVITAVIARMVFEASQRYVKLKGIALPTVLVMEEAHTFIKRYKEDIENQDAASICCQVFERIAREGRKFGLGLVLSSQRPSELSPTVLSQCNSFLLHRISNDRDQDIVNRLVPDNLKGLLRELPSLPSQFAILLGWASELPILVKMNDLPKAQQPRSDDPDFWEVWVGKDDKNNPVARDICWAKVAADWQGLPLAGQEDLA